MKNKKAFLYGTVFGLLAVAFGNELFQALIAFLTGNSEYSINFNYFTIVTEIYADSSLPLFEATLLFVSPIIFSIAVIEFAHFLMKRKPAGTTRFSLVIFNLIVAGYLIVKFFYGAFVSIVSPEIYSDWSGLLNYFEAEFSTKLVLSLFSIILLTGYFNLSSKRVMKYIGGK